MTQTLELSEINYTLETNEITESLSKKKKKKEKVLANGTMI